MHALRSQRKAARAAKDDDVVAACRTRQLRLRELTILLLRLLRANLNRLVVAHVHPRDAGFVTDGPSPTLAPLHAALQELMSGGGGCFDRELQFEAVRVVGDGLEVLYGSMQLRAELLSSLISRHGGEDLTSGRDEADEHLSGAHAELLVRCLRHFSSPSGVVSLLPPAARADDPSGTDLGCEEQSTPRGAKTMATLLGALFEVLHQATARALETPSSSRDASWAAASAAGEQTAALLVHGSALLAAYQRHLLSLVAEGFAEMGDAAAAAVGSGYKDAGVLARDGSASAVAALDAQLSGPQWVAGSRATSFPALRVLGTYAEQLFAQSVRTLDAATSLAEAQVGGAMQKEHG